MELATRSSLKRLAHLALAGLTAAAGCDKALAHFVRNPATTCLSLAPADPAAPASDSTVRALAECRAAVAAAPGDTALLYSLGLVALQSGQTAEMASTFERAASLGSCASLYFVGYHAWYDDKNADSAVATWSKAAECGDKRAPKELFSREAFSTGRADRIEWLYHGDIDSLNRVRFVSASYIIGFYNGLSEQFLGKDFDPCWKATYFRGGADLVALRTAEMGDASNIIESMIYEKSLPFILRVLQPGLGEQSLTEFRETEHEAGKADLIRMIESSSCGSLLPHKIMTGIQKFSTTPRSLFAVARDVAPQIRSLADLNQIFK